MASKDLFLELILINQMQEKAKKNNLCDELEFLILKEDEKEFYERLYDANYLVWQFIKRYLGCGHNK